MLDGDDMYVMDPEVCQEMAQTVIFTVKKILEFQKKSMNKHAAKGEAVIVDSVIAVHAESFIASLVMSLVGTLTQQADPDTLVRHAVMVLNNVKKNLEREGLEFSVKRMRVEFPNA